MVSTPGVMPVTTPPVVTVAWVLLALHAPPGVASVIVARPPTQTVDGPEMALIEVPDETDTTCVATTVPQLPVTEYIIVSVPAVTPVTMPVLPTVAVPLLALHVPPLAPSVSDMVEPTHTADGPVIVPAVVPGSSVTTFVAVAVLQPVVTV